MGRVTLNNAAKSTGMFTLHRFKQRTQQEREQAWHAFRALGVGGSDMSTILGLNAFSTPYDLWLEKTGRSEHEDISGKWAVIKGNALEGELRKRFRLLHPELQVIDGTDVSVVSKMHPIMHASLDGWLYDPETDSWGVLEIKTANASRGRLDWHDDDDNLRIPDYYIAQVTHYMAVTGFTWGYVYADIGENEPVEIRFDRDEQDVQSVITAAEEFWKFVTNDQMPRLKGEDVAKAYPQPDEDIETADDDTELATLMREYETVKERADKAKTDMELLKDALLIRIGNRQGVRCQGFQATYKPYHHDGYTRTVKPSDGRMFRFTKLKAKEGK